MGDEPRSEASAVYLRLKALFTGAAPRSRPRVRRQTDRDEGGSKPFGAGREPHAVGDVLGSLTEQLGWDEQLAESALLAGWPAIVGDALAEKTSVVGIEAGALTISCVSTAWAAQLRLMRNELLARIAHQYPQAGIESIRFNGPDVPSWKKGPRSVPGRGPRDTYG